MRSLALTMLVRSLALTMLVRSLALTMPVCSLALTMPLTMGGSGHARGHRYGEDRGRGVWGGADPPGGHMTDCQSHVQC